MGDVDLALRHVATRHPYDIAQMALPGVTPEMPVAWFDSQSARLERRLDKGLMVTRPADRVIVHNSTGHSSTRGSARRPSRRPPARCSDRQRARRPARRNRDTARARHGDPLRAQRPPRPLSQSPWE